MSNTVPAWGTAIGGDMGAALSGKIWDIKASAADNNWIDICLHTPTGRLVAVAYSGIGNRVMTSGGW